MTEKELKNMTKDELELLCREKGVELDRRLKKSKLVAKAVELFTSAKAIIKKTPKKELERATGSVEIKTNNVHISASEDIKARMRNLNL